MLITISAQGKTPEAPVSARFGRCAWFIQHDTSDGSWDAYENQAAEQSGGAGVSAAQSLIDRGAQSAISGHFGPNAHQALSAAGIKMFTFDDEKQTVAEVFQAYQSDQLTQVQ